MAEAIAYRSKPFKVLITPLAWGLGHATRCIPVIQEFEKRNWEVWIASGGNALILLKKVFPHLSFVEIETFTPQYSTGNFFFLKMMLQLPRFFKVIKREHRELEKVIHEKEIDLIISDNRYGAWSSQIPSLLITHQFNLVVPWKFLVPGVRWGIRKMVQPFTRCWIPDNPGSMLTGNLSDPPLHQDCQYVGILSVFRKLKDEKLKKWKYAIVLSGPEPQRSLLEKLLFLELNKNKETSIVIRGLPAGNSNLRKEGRIVVVDFLPPIALQKILEDTEWIIARSGYSTIMDLVKIGARVLFIPTPGQTEQMYLARRMKEEGWAFYAKQQTFQLEKAMKEAIHYRGFSGINFSDLEFLKAVDQAVDLVVKNDLTMGKREKIIS